MGTSFQDQFLKAGLVNKKQVKKAKHEKRANRKKNKGRSAPDETNKAIETNKAMQEQLAKEKRNRELNQQLNKKKKKLEKLAQVRQLIETNRLNIDNYDEPYYFAVEKKIKKLFINEKINKQLLLGQLAIVKLDDRFEIVPAKVAMQVASRDKYALVVLHKPEKQ